MTLDDLLEVEALFYFVFIHEGDVCRGRRFPVAERRAFTRYVEKALRLPTTYSVNVSVGVEGCVYPWGNFVMQDNSYFVTNADDVRHCLPVPTQAPLAISDPPKFIFMNCPGIEKAFKDDADYIRRLEAHVLSLADDSTGEAAGTRTPPLEQAANAIARKLLDDARKEDS